MIGQAVLRPRTADDLPAAARVLVEVHASDGYPVEGVDDPAAWLTGGALVRAWVAERNGEIVGHVAVSRPGAGDAAVLALRSAAPDEERSALVLGRLFVAPSARGGRLGRQLIDEVVQFAQAAGQPLVLDVMEKDRAAIALYDRMGWTRIAEVLHGDGQGRDHPAFCYRAPDAEPAS